MLIIKQKMRWYLKTNKAQVIVYILYPTNACNGLWNRFQINFMKNLRIGPDNGLVRSENKPLPSPKFSQIYGVAKLRWVNSLAPGGFEHYFREVIFKLISVTDNWGICKIALRLMPLELTDVKSTLAQVMAWCCQATSHYLSQCWPRIKSPYDATRPQWVYNTELRYASFCVDVINNMQEKLVAINIKDYLQIKLLINSLLLKTTWLWQAFQW